jgi:hypothetical protein
VIESADVSFRPDYAILPGETLRESLSPVGWRSTGSRGGRRSVRSSVCRFGPSSGSWSRVRNYGWRPLDR